MSTIGYGDISPQTTDEKIYAICFAIIACGFFGYVISELTSLL